MDIEDTDQTEWMLIYVFDVLARDFVGHAAAHMLLASE